MAKICDQLKEEQLKILQDLTDQKERLKAQIKQQISQNKGSLTNVEIKPIKKPFFYKLKLRLHFLFYKLGVVKI